MVDIIPNCSKCKYLKKIEVQSNCGVFIYFECFECGIRIYSNPEKIICDDFKEM